jgi:hypothetical protein
MIGHERVRGAVVEGDLSPVERDHLASCAACSRFHSRFERALELAPSMLTPPMPAGLPERVMLRLRTAPRGAVAVLPRASAPSAARRRRSVAIAIVAVLGILTLVLVPLLRSPSAQAVLRAAADRTAAQGSALLDLTGMIRGSLVDGGATEGGDRFVLATRSNGGTAFGDRMQLSGSVEVDRGVPGLDLRDRSIEQVVVGDETYALTPGGYREVTGPPVPGQILPSPDTPLEVLETGSDAEVEDLGEEDRDGETVQGYRFDLPPDGFRPPFASSEVSAWTTEVWVGAGDRLLRAMTVSASGLSDTPARFRWQGSFRLDLSGFGAPAFRTDLPGTLSAGRDLILPLPPAGNLAPYEGKRVRGREVAVQSVVADEGVWVGTSRSNRVFVRFRFSGESPPTIVAGDLLSFRGAVRRNPPDAAEAFGVTDPEGARQLAEQEFHVQVEAVRVR